MLIFNFVSVCVSSFCAQFVFPSQKPPPPLSLFFSLLLSSGRLDYAAKEIFSSPPFFFFPPLFTVSHWFGVNAFWMPLGVCRAPGGAGGVWPSGGIWIWSGEVGLRVGEGPKRGTQVRTEVVCRAEEPLRRPLSPLSPSPFPPFFFRVTPFTSSPQVHCQSFLFISKPNPWAKQTYYYPHWVNGWKWAQQIADQIR